MTECQELVEELKREREKDDFFVMLSHDLKNPMTAVIGAIDIVREGRLGPVNSEQVDYLQSAIDSCNEVVTMIDNLLDIRRFEAGKINLTLHDINPAEIARKVAHTFSRAAEYDGITLTTSIIDPPFCISADRTALSRILGNLLSNSLKFTPEGGTIDVSCSCITDVDVHDLMIPPYVGLPDHMAQRRCFVKICVRDSGDGIPETQQQRVFDRYTQSKIAEGRERGGAGLGLAYCKYAVENFKGMIWVESAIDRGSEFIMLFPCVAEPSGSCPSNQQG
ncbi:MAG TPA: HAMP domain-containing histidine kinase [Desulfuromonadales bacterium]|nr:HAMP domain-containing histidine kinase [Desulfuromonadales bacterium]